MAWNAYRELLMAYSQWLLFLGINFIYTSIRNISWVLNGTYWRLLQNQKPENYAECAHVLQIVFKYHLDQFIEPRISDYILVHDRFEHPEYVLRDDITLLTITDSQAIFVKAGKGARPAFHHNFFILGQWDSAEKIITMPLNQFNRLAESMKREGGKIVLLQNQSRCGGTLMMNAFLETGRCVTFNEPGVYNALSKYIFVEQIWQGEEARRMFRNAIHMLCKPYRSLKDGTPLAYVIKPTVTSMICTQLAQESIPDAVQFFLYRNPVEVAISLRRLGQMLPTLKLIYYLPPNPCCVAFLLRMIGHTDVLFRGWKPRDRMELEVGFRMACIAMHYYAKYRRDGVRITGVIYSDLVAHGEKVVRKMFEICGLPPELVPAAMKAFEKDSQEMTNFSRKKIQKVFPNAPKVTAAFMEAAREMAKEFDVKGPEGWEETFRLPGSIDLTA